ncbi:MAG TPA: DUF2891 domain-containing protein [Caulobacteraceae bacterium]
MTGLTAELAERFSRIALSHVEREFPHKLDHVLDGPEDARTPSELHPIFHGSFDWHSCVHGYWLMATCLRLFPEHQAAGQTRALFQRKLTPARVEGELAYLDRPASRGFERPYGWAWLLMLQAELYRHKHHPWAQALQPLTTALSRRFRNHLPLLTYPIRSGAHSNTAFALALAQEYAFACGDAALAQLTCERARGYFLDDRDCQAWEPGGDEFLSPALIEAECLRRMLPPDEFRAWLAAFLPRLGEREPRTLFEPAFVSDRSDGKIAHLDGLNLSRAWCWRGIAAAHEPDDPVRALALEAAERHLEAAMPHLAGDYMGEHWLATFALLAILSL